jgi:hypothetical protein
MTLMRASQPVKTKMPQEANRPGVMPANNA